MEARSSQTSTKTDQTIKVAHIVNSSYLWGVENYILNLGRALKNFGVETLILCRDPRVQEAYEQAGIQTKSFRLEGYLDIAGILSLTKILKDNNVDVLHTHLGLDSLIGAVVARICKIPCVMSVHFAEPAWAATSNTQKRLWRNIQKWKNGMIGHFLPITTKVGKRLQIREGVEIERMTVVNPGLRPLSFVSSNASTVRSQLGALSDDCIILTLSRLEAEKNVSALISAAVVLTAENHLLKFWVAGDGSEREMLEKQIRHHNLQDRFFLLGYRRDTDELLAAADIFVLPAIAEPFGMSAVEAMLAAKPVVGFGNAGLFEIVADRESGLLAEEADLNALTECIRILSLDAFTRQQYGQAGYKRALALFTDEIMARKVLDVYKNVLNRPPPS